MKIDLQRLDYKFNFKPLLIGGKAMEYYDLRKAGEDIDFVISKEDFAGLSQKYPKDVKSLYGDLGVITKGFELWTSICLFNYDQLVDGAINQGDFLVIALDKLLILKALGMKEAKYHKDLELIVEKILNIQYGKDSLPK